MKVKAGIMYSFMGILGFGGVVAILMNLRNQTHAGKFWILGGICLIAIAFALILLIKINKKRIMVKRKEEAERVELKSLLINGDGFFIDVSYKADDDSIGSVKLNLRCLRMRERNNDDTSDTITITKYTEYYQCKSLFIVWPTEVSETNKYELVVSREIYIILEYFMRRCYAE